MSLIQGIPASGAGHDTISEVVLSRSWHLLESAERFLESAQVDQSPSEVRPIARGVIGVELHRLADPVLGFFVPTDSEGRTAVLEGTFNVSETSVAALKHLLEDAGKTEEAAKVTEPRIEMKVMADGVALKKM